MPTWWREVLLIQVFLVLGEKINDSLIVSGEWFLTFLLKYNIKKKKKNYYIKLLIVFVVLL